MQGTSSLFITDPLDELNPKKDTTILWMQEVFSMGGQILQCEMKDLIYKDQETFANFFEIKDPITNPQIGEIVNQAQPLKDIDYVFMRKDPPVDEDYMNALHLLSQAEAEGANIVNRPSALKKFNEKIFALQFSHWMPDTSVICKEKDFELFKQKYSTIILKPLDGMGGESIYKMDNFEDDNLDILLDMTDNENTQIIAQEFLQDIYKGDFRILIINGRPFPKTLARIPQGESFKGNLAAGGVGVVKDITEVQQRTAEKIGDYLIAKGINFAGIDMIGKYLTEINITSPTCAREIFKQSGKNPIKEYLEIL